jgi:hypothetical protein
MLWLLNGLAANADELGSVTRQRAAEYADAEAAASKAKREASEKPSTHPRTVSLTPTRDRLLPLSFPAGSLGLGIQIDSPTVYADPLRLFEPVDLTSLGKWSPPLGVTIVGTESWPGIVLTAPKLPVNRDSVTIGKKEDGTVPPAAPEKKK